MGSREKADILGIVVIPYQDIVDIVVCPGWHLPQDTVDILV